MFCSQCNHCTASMDLKEISDLQAFWFVRKQRPRQSRRAKSERRRGPRHSWPNLQRCVVMVIIFQNMVIGASEIDKGVGLRGPPNKLLHKCQTERWQLYKQKADEFHEVFSSWKPYLWVPEAWNCLQHVYNREICCSTHSEVANPMGQKSYTFWRGHSKAMTAMSFWECAKCRIFWAIPTPPKISRACSIIDLIALQRNNAWFFLNICNCC